MTSHDIAVGVDAFLERGEQVVEGVTFVSQQCDRFAPLDEHVATWTRLQKRKPSVDELFDVFFDLGLTKLRTTPSIPTRWTYTVMSVYERELGNTRVWHWLDGARNGDDVLTLEGLDLEVYERYLDGERTRRAYELGREMAAAGWEVL